MKPINRERLCELCKKAAVEQGSARHLKLIIEMTQLLKRPIATRADHSGKRAIGLNSTT